MLVKNLAFTKILTGCIEDNTDYYGHDMKKVQNIPSASACACACRDNTGCSVFTWTKRDKVCYLKTSDKGRQRSDGAYSGTLHCCTGKANNSNTSKLS